MTDAYFAPQGPTPSRPAGEQEQEERRGGRELLEWLLVFVAVLLIAGFVRAYIAEPVQVDGRSMLETLKDGEYVLVAKYPYLFDDPKRYDVVACYYPGDTQKLNVKRVFGLPGETVELREGVLYVDGEYVPQDMLEHPRMDNLGPITLAPGYYFVMGDNRQNSRDSRVVGAIARDAIIGQVVQVIYPLKAFRSVVYEPEDAY